MAGALSSTLLAKRSLHYLLFGNFEVQKPEKSKPFTLQHAFECGELLCDVTECHHQQLNAHFRVNVTAPSTGKLKILIIRGLKP